MAAEEPNRPEPAGGPPALWYRSWRFYLVLVLGVAAYAYGWKVTQINLGELWRGASLIEPFARSLASPDVGGKFEEQGALLRRFSPAEFAAFLRKEQSDYAEIVRAAGIKEQ